MNSNWDLSTQDLMDRARGLYYRLLWLREVYTSGNGRLPARFRQQEAVLTSMLQELARRSEGHSIHSFNLET